MTKSGNSPEYKDKRRKDLQRKKDDKRKRNPIAKELHNPLYHPKVIENKEKGGSKNLLRDINID